MEPVTQGLLGAAVVVAGYFGINPPGFVAQVVAFAFGLAASSFFPAIILGIFFKRVNVYGAISGMLVGLAFTAGYIVYFKFPAIMAGIGITSPANVPENWLFGISPEGIGSLGMIINFVIAISVSFATKPPPKEIIELVDSVRYPRKAMGGGDDSAEASDASPGDDPIEPEIDGEATD